jgi:hypothetical protein
MNFNATTWTPAQIAALVAKIRAEAAEAKAIGMPAGNAAELLAVTCPWCESGPWQSCVNPGTYTDSPVRAHVSMIDIIGTPES